MKTKATTTKTKKKALTLQEQCERNNAAYEKATPARRRVMIAKDALQQIKDENITPITGNYIGCGAFVGRIRPEEPLQPVLLNEEQPINCRCCAKGTLFISCVRLSNRFEGSPCCIDSGTINATVGWPENNYHQIESAFEGYYAGCYDDDEGEEIIPRGNHDKAIHKWQKKYKDEKKRLVAILKNIISNRGLFKLKDI